MKQSQLVKVYGNPGLALDAPDPKWVKANIVYAGGVGKAERPAMPGVPTRLWFAVHRKAEPRMRAGFTAAVAACPTYTIAAAGCFVFRRQRWDTVDRAKSEGRAVRQLSDHAFGGAVDINAPKNRGIEFARGKEPKPWSKAWLDTWPDGMPESFVRAFCKAADAEWGGDWPAFKDPMHLSLRW